MSEIITIQVGQCGNQIGSAFWPMILQEHGISSDSDSYRKPAYTDALHSFFNCPKDVPLSGYSSISDLKKANVTARCILIDMEEHVVKRFERGPLRDLFAKTCLLKNQPGSGNNWAVGHYEHGSQQKEKMIEMIRKSVESCDYLHGFLMLFSLGGGTGSGLGSYILQLLDDYYTSVDRLVACVHPGSYNDVVTSPYNAALTFRKLTEHASCVLPVDNKALTDICMRLIPLAKPLNPYSDMNNLIVRMLLHVTSGSRFPGPLNVDLNELATNMTPFKGLHYLTSSFSPFDSNPTVLKNSELLNSVCNRANQLLRVDPFAGTILSAMLMCRGNLAVSDSRDFVDRFYNKANFVSWNKNGIKTGLCSVPLINHSKSLLCITNSTSTSELFADTTKHFNKLYSKKAHVHHYLKVNGFEEAEFDSAVVSMSDTIENYRKSCNKIEIPRLDIV